MSEAPPPSLHGVALVVRDAGVLIRGRSGAGKTRLAEELAAAAQARGWFSRLVADDRVRFVTRGGRLLLSPHPAIAGMVERHGEGVFPVEHEASAVLRLVIDIVERDRAQDRPPRYPDEEDTSAEIAGLRVPRLALAIGEGGAALAAIRKIVGEDA